MKETFMKTLVACTAAGLFGTGAYTLGSQVVSVMDSRVAAILAAQAQRDSSAVPADANGRQ